MSWGRSYLCDWLLARRGFQRFQGCCSRFVVGPLAPEKRAALRAEEGRIVPGRPDPPGRHSHGGISSLSETAVPSRGGWDFSLLAADLNDTLPVGFSTGLPIFIQGTIGKMLMPGSDQRLASGKKRGFFGFFACFAGVLGRISTTRRFLFYQQGSTGVLAEVTQKQVMANIKSVEKRARQSVKRHERNTQVLSALKTAKRRVRSAIAGGDSSVVKEQVSVLSAELDKAAKRGIIHRNVADRSKSRARKALTKATAAAN
jgi:small subunit ribosomal protein S20